MQATSIEEQLAFYRENGYLVIPDALSRAQVDVLNAEIDRNLVEDRSLWSEREQSHYRLNVHILMAHEACDCTMRPPPCWT